MDSPDIQIPQNIMFYISSFQTNRAYNVNEE